MQICESKLIQKAEIRPTGCFIPSVTFQTQVISGGAYPRILLLIPAWIFEVDFSELVRRILRDLVETS